MGDSMIKIEHLHKTYRSGFLMKPKLALKDVSFSVEPGQVYGLSGRMVPESRRPSRC